MQLRHGLIISSIISWLWSSPYSTIDHLSSTINVTVMGNWVWEQMTWVTCVLLLEWNSKLKWKWKDKKKQLAFFLNAPADNYSIEFFEVILQMIHFLINDGQCAVIYILLEHSRESEVGGFRFMKILILILWAILKGNIGWTWPPSPKYYRRERGPAVPSYLPFYLTSITYEVTGRIIGFGPMAISIYRCVVGEGRQWFSESYTIVPQTLPLLYMCHASQACML